MVKTEPVFEPMATIKIDGIDRQVPASHAELEELIRDGAALELEISEKTQQLEDTSPRLREEIKNFEAIVAQLKLDLGNETADLAADIGDVQTRLDGIKAKIVKVAKPMMGKRKSWRFTGLAGKILVERKPKMEVDRAQIPALRKLLGDEFCRYFQVAEEAQPLELAWDLPQTLKGHKLKVFVGAVAISDPGRVRFLAGDK